MYFSVCFFKVLNVQNWDIFGGFKNFKYLCICLRLLDIPDIYIYIFFFFFFGGGGGKQ